MGRAFAWQLAIWKLKLRRQPLCRRRSRGKRGKKKVLGEQEESEVSGAPRNGGPPQETGGLVASGQPLPPAAAMELEVSSRWLAVDAVRASPALGSISLCPPSSSSLTPVQPAPTTLLEVMAQAEEQGPEAIAMLQDLIELTGIDCGKGNGKGKDPSKGKGKAGKGPGTNLPKAFGKKR